MFENEVQITLSLKHDNVVVAFDGFPTGRNAFLTLEYCSGGTLDQLLLEQGRLPLVRAAQFIADVALGLEHSHSRKVLHRDVKPANVFLTGEARAKLGDFGTGMFFTEQTDERVGTAFYMAPEVFEGKTPSVQSDVYSLGVLAYEVLTGVRPFEGDSYDALMLAHLSGIPKSISHYRKDVSSDLRNVIAQAMSRDSEKRFKNVRQFTEALTKASDITIGPKVTRTGRASRSARLPKNPNHKTKPANKGFFSWFRRNKKN